MSPSIILSFSTIFFTTSILILVSSPKTIVASPSSPSLIQKACSNHSINIDTKICLQVLQSIPSVVSAQNLSDLSIAIIDSGISNFTNTLAHLETVLNQRNAESRVKEAFKECKLSYDQVVDRFVSAFAEVRIREYVGATYDLLTASSDYIISCDKAMAKQNVRDEIISRGNKIVPIFGLSAFSVIDDLDRQPRSPPPMAHHHY